MTRVCVCAIACGACYEIELARINALFDIAITHFRGLII